MAKSKQIEKFRTHSKSRSYLAERAAPSGPRYVGLGHTVGLRAGSPTEVVRKIEAGLPFVAIEKLQKVTGFALERIAELTRISNRTMARRKGQGKFNSEESERVLRLATVIERAIDLFDGDLAAAKRWLETPRRAFGGKPALAFAETEVGAREVQDLIGRIEHGVIS